MTEGRDRARQAVRDELARRGWTRMDLVDESGASVDAVTDFLKDRDPSWPRTNTLTRIEKALGWPAGRLEQIAKGGETLPPVDMDGITMRLVVDPMVWDRMSPSERAEAEAVAQAAIYKRIREIVERRDDA